MFQFKSQEWILDSKESIRQTVKNNKQEKNKKKIESNYFITL